MSIATGSIRAPRWAVRSLLCILLAACGGAPARQEADPELVAQRESDLLSPFEGNATLVADDLSIELTANFWGSALGLPALVDESQAQKRRQREDGGTEYLYENHAPGASMTFLLGSTQIRVKRTARVAVLGGKHDYTLDVDANGRVSLVDKDGRRDGSRYQVRGGKALLTP